MNWIDVAVFSGLAFVVGCCTGVLIELWKSSKEYKVMWKMYNESEKFHQELQDALVAKIEMLEDINIEQYNIIEMLGGHKEVAE